MQTKNTRIKIVILLLILIMIASIIGIAVVFNIKLKSLKEPIMENHPNENTTGQKEQNLIVTIVNEKEGGKESSVDIITAENLTADYHAKASAYLLDTGMWSGFKDSSGYAEYAVGGPTIELFVESYNQTHTKKTIDTRVGKNQSDSPYGYQLKWSTEEWADNAYDGKNAEIQGIDCAENLYIMHNDKAIAYWIASPSVVGEDRLLAAIYYDIWEEASLINVSYSDHSIGARPVVSLKPNVVLEKTGEGTCKIVEP